MASMIKKLGKKHVGCCLLRRDPVKAKVTFFNYYFTRKDWYYKGGCNHSSKSWRSIANRKLRSRKYARYNLSGGLYKKLEYLEYDSCGSAKEFLHIKGKCNQKGFWGWGCGPYRYRKFRKMKAPEREYHYQQRVLDMLRK